ncbi:MAG: DUF4954 family protein [Chitinivibrionales bacterium]|nr:DUF4954 family protein [Chitinivibrionales bacterium]
MDIASYASLTREQIDILENNRCTCDDWSLVKVAEGFVAEYVDLVTFSGTIFIGNLDSKISFADGVKDHPHLHNAHVHNVEIGDFCVISNVSGHLSNLKIGNNVRIENVGYIACTGKSSFGNGQEVAVLNEGGGRTLRITAETGAQAAYLSVMYRHNDELIDALDSIARRYADAVSNNVARIGDHVAILNVKELINTDIGPHAVIRGVSLLNNVTVVSKEDAPTLVTHGVIAEHSIIQKGAHVKDGSLVTRCLIGEGARIGKQFSAENSLLFANAEGYHSEVASLFAGPYSVTHHRSTLLIAACISFYNAGSGTNQSNHMYKLGPLHQGVLERGCKTGSFSYLLWPAAVGAYTAIIGKHYANFDTREFPFSYISEEQGKSVIVPGMNLFTVGTLRDAAKWPRRDRRNTDANRDLIHFNLFSPFIGQKLLRGRDKLMELYRSADREQEYIVHNGIYFKRILLKNCSRYYTLAIEKYFGNVLAEKCEAVETFAAAKVMQPASSGLTDQGEWIDMCGMFCAKERVAGLIHTITTGKITDYSSLHRKLMKIYNCYHDDEWNWVLQHCEAALGFSPEKLSGDVLKSVLDRWKEASVKLLHMARGDAAKEFGPASRIGYGIDGESEGDFVNVRGTVEANDFLHNLQNEQAEIERRHAAIVAKLR